jgi:predicted transcriptional regulator of viral defense system
VTRLSSPEKAQHVLKRLGIARSWDLEGEGISRTQLRRLLERGLIDRVGRGLYGLPGAARTERHHLAEAARRVPGGVVCLLSALRFHGLTTQNPFEVWMAIDRRAWRPRVEHPPLRLVYLSGPALREGVEDHDVGGVTVRVFSAAKTVADCFKFRNKIGTDVAVEALRDYRRLHPKRLEAVWRFAEVDRVTRVILPYLEAVGLTKFQGWKNWEAGT